MASLTPEQKLLLTLAVGLFFAVLLKVLIYV